MKSNEKKYSLISAILFFALGLYSVILGVIDASQYEYYTITFLTVFYWAVTFALGAVALLRKNNIIALVATGANVVLRLIYVVQYTSLYNVLDLLVAAALLVLVLFVSIDQLKRNAKISKMIWFAPAAIFLVNNVIMWIQQRFFRHISYTWPYMVSAVVEIAALLFMGLWIMELAKNATEPVASASNTQYATFNPESYATSQQTSSVIGNADKLKIYKELLDSGAITQEEFDAKKKQILGL